MVKVDGGGELQSPEVDVIPIGPLTSFTVTFHREPTPHPRNPGFHPTTGNLGNGSLGLTLCRTANVCLSFSKPSPNTPSPTNTVPSAHPLLSTPKTGNRIRRSLYLPKSTFSVLDHRRTFSSEADETLLNGPLPTPPPSTSHTHVLIL